MKKIIPLLTIILFTLNSCLSLKTVPVAMEPITDVIEVKGLKNDLFVKVNNWMVENFNNAKSVIQFTDKESGTVTGKYLLHYKSIAGGAYSYAQESEVYAIIKILVKDGASQITVSASDFEQFETPASYQSDFYYSETKAKKAINDLIEGFKTYMKTQSVDF